ncbi:MAG: helix-turn-helix domain-containing protein [Candidatus Njordarchaeia archaeon]
MSFENEEDLNFLRRTFIYLLDKIVGDGGFQIAITLLNQGSLTDEQISEITGLPITTVRNILITLQNLGLLSLIKEKQKNTGWINYYWYIDPLSVKRFLKERLRVSILNLKKFFEELNNDNFYYCPECNITYVKDDAEENDFKCRVCGSPLLPLEAPKNLEKLIKGLIERYANIK